MDITKLNIDDVNAAIARGDITAAEALELERARGNEARKSLIETLEQATANPTTGSTAGNSELAEQLEQYDDIRVRTAPSVHPKGAFYDPEQRRTIGREAITVKHTPFVRQRLRNEELVEVDE